MQIRILFIPKAVQLKLKQGPGATSLRHMPIPSGCQHEYQVLAPSGLQILK